jgi:hypothetical protein
MYLKQAQLTNNYNQKYHMLLEFLFWEYKF